MISFPELMFYAEAEGYLPTRQGKINKVIREIRDFPAPEIDISDVERLLNKEGLSYKTLTAREKRQIERGISWQNKKFLLYLYRGVI